MSADICRFSTRDSAPLQRLTLLMTYIVLEHYLPFASRVSSMTFKCKPLVSALQADMASLSTFLEHSVICSIICFPLI